VSIDSSIQVVSILANQKSKKKVEGNKCWHENDKKRHAKLYTELGLDDPLEKCDKRAEFKRLMRKRKITFTAVFNSYNFESEMRPALRYTASIMSQNYGKAWTIERCALLAQYCCRDDNRNFKSREKQKLKRQEKSAEKRSLRLQELENKEKDLVDIKYESSILSDVEQMESKGKFSIASPIFSVKLISFRKKGF